MTKWYKDKYFYMMLLPSVPCFIIAIAYWVLSYKIWSG